METELEKFDELCRQGEVSGPVEDLVIERAEAELGVHFPSDYRQLLRNYGAVLAGGIEVFGLSKAEDNDPPLWQDVVALTKQLREWGQAGADQHNMVAICEDGSGIYFYVDTSASPETRICAFGPGIEQIYDTSLLKFLLDLSKAKLTV